MAVSFIDLKRYEPGFQDRWYVRVREITEKAAFIGGVEVETLESRLAAQAGNKHCITCANGTDALQLALRACGVGAGDAVIVPELTFWATFEAVVNVAANPYTVDIHPTDLQMDFDLFVKACEQVKPKAAILVHLYGWASSRLADFRQYCQKQGIALIEDGAQSFGAEWQGRSIYQDALISTVSFYPAKVFGAAGDAGAVFTNNDELAEALRSLGNHGREKHYSHGLVGWNSRLSGLQAAFLNLSLDYLPKRLDERRSTIERYSKDVAKPWIRVVRAPESYRENGYLNVLLVDAERRAGVENTLKEKGIGFGIVYPETVSSQKGAAPFIKGTFGGNVARQVTKSVLNLPVFPYMTDAEYAEVIHVVGNL